MANKLLKVSEFTPDAVADKLVEKTVLVDYLEVADHAGAAIPDNVFSRKGSTPYFGNAPIGNGTQAEVAGILYSTVALTKVLLASVPLEASRVVAGFLPLRFEAYTDIAAVPFVADRFALWIDFDGSTDPSTSGLVLLIRNAVKSNYYFNGRLVVNLVPASGLTINYGSSNPSCIHAGGARAVTADDDWLDMTYGSPVGIAPVGVANHLNFYLIDLTGGAAAGVSVEGTFAVKG